MSPFRIMVVDDEEDMRTIIAATLKGKYEVTEAFDGLDALDKIDHHQPDLVILDVNMPLMNGLEACKAIRNNPDFQNTPVMFLSGLGEREDIKKGYEAGANVYLAKPVDPGRLLKNIDLFFERFPSSPREKQYGIDEIIEMDKVEKKAVSSPEIKEEVEPLEPIPAKTAEIADKPSEKERHYRVYDKPRVMVVDDDPDVTTMLSVAMRDDFEVVKAMDGLEAIAKIVRYQPDILVVDIMMPKMSGYQLCQSIRRNRTFQDLPIIVASAKSSRRDQDYALKSGASFFIAKPFEPGRIVKVVESFTQREDFTIRKKRLTFHEINELEKEDKERKQHREGEQKKKQQRAELKKHIIDEMEDSSKDEEK